MLRSSILVSIAVLGTLGVVVGEPDAQVDPVLQEHLNRYNSLLEANDYDAAADELGIAFQRFPTHYELAMRRALVLKTAGKVEGAVDVYCDLANILAANNRVQDAKNIFEAAVALDKTERSSIQQADFLHRTGDASGAASSLVRVASHRMARGEYEWAKIAASRALDLDSGSTSAMLLLGAAQNATGDGKNAAQSYFVAGNALYGKGDSAGAIKAFSDSISCSSAAYMAYRNLAAVYSEAGDKEKAAAALFRLGIVLYDADELALASDTFAQARSLAPHFHLAVINHAIVERRRGNAENSARYLLELAEMYLKENKNDFAMAAYKGATLDSQKMADEWAAGHPAIAVEIQKSNEEQAKAQFEAQQAAAEKARLAQAQADREAAEKARQVEEQLKAEAAKKEAAEQQEKINLAQAHINRAVELHAAKQFAQSAAHIVEASKLTNLPESVHQFYAEVVKAAQGQQQ